MRGEGQALSLRLKQRMRRGFKPRLPGGSRPGGLAYYRHSGLTDLLQTPDSDNEQTDAWTGTGPVPTVKGALYRPGEGQALALQ